MKTAQHTPTSKVFLHPTACSRARIDAFQRRTGLHIVVNANGNAEAVIPAGGAA